MDIVLSLPELPDDTSRLPLARPESKLTEVTVNWRFCLFSLPGLQLSVLVV